MNGTVDNYQVVYFTTRSVGTAKIGYILQIVAKFHDGATYSEWVKPPKAAEKFLGDIPGLKTENGELFYEDEKLRALPLEVALGTFYIFLNSSPKPVVLVDFSQRIVLERLLQAFLRTDTVDAFYNVIAAFSDSHSRFREEVTRRWGGIFFNFSYLAEKFLGEEFEDGFDKASHRLEILEKLTGSQGLKTFLSERQWNGTPRVTDKPEIQEKIIRRLVAETTSQHGQNEDQVDDETGELTQKRSSGNSETGPSSRKRPAIFRRRKNPRSQKSCVLA